MLVSEDVSTGTVIFTCEARDPDLSTLLRGQLEYFIIGQQGLEHIIPRHAKFRDHQITPFIFFFKHGHSDRVTLRLINESV